MFDPLLLERELGISYSPSPSQEAFHKDSESRVKILSLSEGGGKTVACLMELLYLMLTAPVVGGLRKSRIGIIHTTRLEKRSFEKTFDSWVTPQAKPVNSKYNVSPVGYDLLIKLTDGTVVDSEWKFLSSEDPEFDKTLMSIELTHCYIDNIQWQQDAYTYAREMISRYPNTRVDGKVLGTCPVLEPTHWLMDLDYRSRNGIKDSRYQDWECVHPPSVRIYGLDPTR